MDQSAEQLQPQLEVDGVSTPAAERRLSALTSMLKSIEEPAASKTPADLTQPTVDHQNQLVQVRLGLASSLFVALRAKHAPTAQHCMRVALGCSSWAMNMSLNEEQRDEIEVAALLHDVGKIGVPDDVLLKPGRLTSDEAVVIERHRRFGAEILSSCCVSQELLDIVQLAGAWHDGSRQGFEKRGDEIPLGARMIAIVDAFDSMTTDVVYRRALSRERAVAELFACAGSQFDAQLVESFCNLLTNNDLNLNAKVASRWLRQLHPDKANSMWRLSETTSLYNAPSINDLYHFKLLESMHDGVVFVDNSMKIVHWNRAAERLTGISSKSVYERQWSPSLIEMHDENDQPITDAECPLSHAIESCVQTLRRLTVRSRDGKRTAVDAHMVPVFDTDGTRYGGTLLLHDASSQITLEERVQSLHHRATCDPLTKVANRSEFDRVHAEFISTHLDVGLPCSLVICDIDHFKKINDTYGHANGDEALREFAKMLKQHTRAGDLVARFGGEEFVMLCADCDIATATERADELREAIARTPQAAVGGKAITASFGVTELQPGDDEETMLRRADRALYIAKENGRNRVMQLGSGVRAEAKPDEQPTSWFSWMQGKPIPEESLKVELVTPVPGDIVVQKLRGFVSDHHAEIISSEESKINLKIDAQHAPMQRRTSDRPVPFFIFLELREAARVSETGKVEGTRSHVLVTIKPKNKRDRRSAETAERAPHLLRSLKSYLMAQEAAPDEQVFGK